MIVLLLVVILLGVTWLLFGDRILRDAAVESATKALGAQVDIAALDLRLRNGTVRIRGVRIADPFDPMRNLLEADTLRVVLDPRALLERKFVVERLVLAGGRAGTRRAVAAAPVSGGGFAPAALREWSRWKSQFAVPLLSLAPVDTIRAIALDPMRLATVRRAIEVKAGADSLRAAVDSSYRALRLRETLDSSRALVDRLREADPRALGLDGTRRAVADLRRGIAEVKRARERVESLERIVVSGAAHLAAGVRSLDDARRDDYAMARGLLKLPSLESPEIGSAMFGRVSLDRFQQAMYWVDVAGHHLPPGLRPRTSAGPDRLRRSGTTVRFPRAREYPAFHLRRADLSVALGTGSSAATYVARVRDVTTEPALVGSPVVANLRRSSAAGGRGGLRVDADARLDRGGGRLRDSAVVAAAGVSLPSLGVPGLPLRLEPGVGDMDFRLLRAGGRIAARWQVRADSVGWRADSSRVLNRVESLVTRVLGGIRRLELSAELEGDLRRPTLRVRSNLDRAVAERLRAVLGEEVARAESRVRAEVDRIVAERTAPVRAQVDSVRTDLTRRVEEAKERLDAERTALEARLRALSGGLIRIGAAAGARPGVSMERPRTS